MGLWIDAIDVIDELKRGVALDNAAPLREGKTAAIAWTAVGRPGDADGKEAVGVWNEHVWHVNCGLTSGVSGERSESTARRG